MGITPRRHRRPRIALAGLAAVLAAAVVPAGPARLLGARAAGCDAWMDTSKTPDQRAAALLAAMSQSEKLAMTTAPNPYGSVAWAHDGVAGYIPSPNTALCIPDLVLNDAGQGVGDFMTGTTAFPAPIAQAASWDPVAQETFGSALGGQAFAKGVNVQLTPGIETNRVPMNGRNWEYMGEDPYLSGQTAAAVVRGVQSQHVIATIKHYVTNSQETNRTSDSSDIDERTMHELYLPQYETAVQQGGAAAVMCSYNRINSVYACENPQTLTTDLRNQIGFTGFVMSDWGGTHSTAPAANAGLDMEMGSNSFFGSALGTAVQGGQVSSARLDLMVSRTLRSMFAVGLFDHPVAQGTVNQTVAAATPVDTPAANTLAGQIAAAGIVLLKNQSGILPLQAPLKRIAMIGTVAGPAGAQIPYNGGGSGHIPEAGYKGNIVSPLQGMTTLAVPAGDVVTYADGNGPQFADAVAAATAADVAVVVVYDSKSEGTDQASLTLPPDGSQCLLIACVTGAGYDQNALVSAVAKANPNTVVVVESGGPVTMPWINDVRGVIEAWYPGQDGGDAIASVLMGTVNPSAKLPQTFPVSEKDLPTTTAAQWPGVQGSGQTFPHSAYTEGLDVGYRWFDDHNVTPLFPFGYGLSYTSFSYSHLSIAPAPTPQGQAVVSFDVTNTGAVSGAEVPQVYVGAPAVNPVNEPLKQLRAYRKVSLQPGQTAHLSLPVDGRAVSYWDSARHAWAAEAGCHPVLVGSSSRDIRLQAPGVTEALQLCGAATVPTAAQPTPSLVNTSPARTGGLPAAGSAAAVLTLAALRRRRRRRAG